VKVAITCLVLLSLLVTPAVLRYSGDLMEARSRSTSGSTLLAADCATIEYALAGEGTPLLVIHGAGGGFDQGLGFARELTSQGIRVIAPSRFGYLRSPAPADVSPQAQADAFACLLDALRIERAAIVGASAGAPSAVQFCIRHPDRCSALVLLVPALYSPAHAQQTMEHPAALQFIFDYVLGVDPVLWLITRVRPQVLVRTILATPQDVFEKASPAERKRVSAMLDGIQPVSARRAGLLIDARVTQQLPRFELEGVKAPTLAISLQDDLYGTFENARYTASQIAGAQFISYPSGGHVWIGHDEDVLREVGDFVRAHPGDR
jgi:2-hydroxy-6-oxonona-2,4-dienedioate hydrolase